MNSTRLTTSWSWIRPQDLFGVKKLANKEAGTTVRALENIFLKISMPFMIQTDNRRNFYSKEFE